MIQCVLVGVLIARLLLTNFYVKRKFIQRVSCLVCYFTGQLCGLPLGSWAVSKLGQIIVYLCFVLVYTKDKILSLKKSLSEYSYVFGGRHQRKYKKRLLL